jgi:hypothetical protein
MNDGVVFFKFGAKLQQGIGHMASDPKKKIKKNAFFIEKRTF